MNLIQVRFNDEGKIYNYKTALNLIEGAFYNIVANGTRTYDNPVKVIRVSYGCNPCGLSTITNATCLNAPRTESPIKQVYFNESKGVTTVLWKDGTKTMVKLKDGETFDKQTALAYCYMKRYFQTTGGYRAEFKRWCGDD